MLQSDLPDTASFHAPADHVYNVDVAGRTFTFRTGKLAFQAGGAVTVTLGETVVLATATASQAPREGIDFFPLSVDLEEKLYAAGRIPGSFFKREGRPSEAAILAARLVDRPLRPLFPKSFRNDVQVILTVLSSDGQNYFDIPALVAASAALTISDIPLAEPVAAVRVGLVGGAFVINPTAVEMETSTLDLRVAGTADAVIMVECGAQEVDEDTMIRAILAGHQAMQPLISVQHEMRQAVGKPNREFAKDEVPDALRMSVRQHFGRRLDEALDTTSRKEARGQALDALKAEWSALFADDETVKPSHVKAAFDEYFKERVRERILSDGLRPDGRKPTELRSLSSEVSLLPRTHGTGLFQRGETQVLSITTLGTLGEEQRLDTLRPEETKRLMHHYNFPPFSTGEAYPLRGPKRREIGHGALAETALRAIVPNEQDFPYTIRIVSEVLSSNGSSSMASVCASTLSLMDAGVPIKAPVAGIAMGLISAAGDPGRAVVLTDIQGMEDALGDMDFKVAGTAAGITALQMDIKLGGLNESILRQALAQARDARLAILENMHAAMPGPRAEMSKYAPRIITIKIDPELIGKLIGPGGKTIRALEAETGAKIDIQNDGTVHIACVEGEGGELALARVKGLTAGPELGMVYSGKVVRITDFGAFVEILPGLDGLVHISQLSDTRVQSVDSVVQLGDEILVMVTDVADGRVRLSRQAVLAGWTLEEARANDPGVGGGARGGSRGGGGGDRGRGGPRR